MSERTVTEKQAAFTHKTVEKYKSRNEELEARNKQLEHWFNDYLTPEMSMAAMLKRIEELEAKLKAEENRVAAWHERKWDKIVELEEELTYAIEIIEGSGVDYDEIRTAYLDAEVIE